MQISNTFASDTTIITLKNDMRKYIAYYTRIDITIKRIKTLLLKAQ